MSSNSVIPNTFSGLQFFVYKGQFLKKLIITHHMIGSKFGNFIFTKKPFFFPIKEPKKKKK